MALDIFKPFDRVWHAGLRHKLKSDWISGEIFGLISSFLSNRRLQVVLHKTLHKNIQLMLKLLEALFLVLHFPYYTLMTFLMMLLFILSVTRLLICGNNLSWLLNLNLIYETLWTRVRSGLLISMLGKLSWFRLTGLITMVLLMWKWMGLFLRKNHLLKCWVWPLLNWIGVLTLSLLLKLTKN